MQLCAPAFATGLPVLEVEDGSFQTATRVNGIDRQTPIGESYRGVVPFLISDVIRTALLLAFPALSLTLVRAMN